MQLTEVQMRLSHPVKAEVERMSQCLRDQPKFLFDPTQRSKYGFVFNTSSWDSDNVLVDVVNNCGDKEIDFRFRLKDYVYPQEIVNVLHARGWIINSQYRTTYIESNKINGIPWSEIHIDDDDPWTCVWDKTKLKTDMHQLRQLLQQLQTLLVV